jgi:hypothetical protein
MTVEPVDFYYHRSDEELRAYLQLTTLEKLTRLDELRRFILMVRQAPTVHPQAAEPAAEPYPTRPSD